MSPVTTSRRRCTRRRLRQVAASTAHDLTASDGDDPDLAGGDVSPVGVDDAGLDAREGVADGAGDAVTVVRVRGGDARFGHAVALTDPMPGSIGERSEGRFCEWRGPHVNSRIDAHRSAVGARRAEPGVVGRHAHEDGALRKPIEYRIDIEATQEGDGNGGQQRAVQCHEEAVDVEDRQAVDEVIVRGEVPCVVKGVGVGSESLVGEGGAFGSAGGS